MVQEGYLGLQGFLGLMRPLNCPSVIPALTDPLIFHRPVLPEPLFQQRRVPLGGRSSPRGQLPGLLLLLPSRLRWHPLRGQ